MDNPEKFYPMFYSGMSYNGRSVVYCSLISRGTLPMAKLKITDFMDKNYKLEDFAHLHWEGTFQEYLDIVAENPIFSLDSII